MPKSTRMITYRGHEMAARWPATICAAQRQKTVSRDGVSYARIPYGQEAYWREPDMEFSPTCGDCGVIPGEFHVDTCDMEACPICLTGQWLCCRDGQCPNDFDGIDEDIAQLPVTQNDVYAPTINIPDTQLPLL
jgi:hypothetical protein